MEKYSKMLFNNQEDLNISDTEKENDQKFQTITDDYEIKKYVIKKVIRWLYKQNQVYKF